MYIFHVPALDFINLSAVGPHAVPVFVKVIRTVDFMISRFFLDEIFFSPIHPLMTSKSTADDFKLRR